jgi:hypothetical protein
MIDPDTLIIIAGIPTYGIVTIVVAKMALTMFESQQVIQTQDTATPPGKA